MEKTVRVTLPTLLLALPLATHGCGGAEATGHAGAARPRVVGGAVTAAMGSPHPGDPAPDFELTDQRGASLRLSSLRGSIVVLAFGTSWCPYSAAELGSLRTLDDQYRARNVNVVLVDVDEAEPAYRSYVERDPIAFPVLRDEDGRVARAYAPPGAQPDLHDRSRVPIGASLVIDRDGTIQHYLLVDSVAFDAELDGAREMVDRLLDDDADGAVVPGAVTRAMGPPNVGDVAPDLEAVADDGSAFRSTALRGHVVVLHFGTSWCPFCTEELPHLQRLQADYAARGVRVVLVDVREDRDAYREYASRFPLTLTMVRDPDGSAASRFAPPGAMPAIRDRSQVPIASNLVLDRDGRIRFFTLVDTARFDAHLVRLRRDLDAVLAEAE